MKTDINSLPIHIDKDGLYNAIVVLHIESVYNIKYLLNVVMEKLNEKGNPYYGFTIVANPDVSNKDSDRQYIANNDYRIMFADDMISFNIVSGYKGWNNYKGFLMTVIHDLFKIIKIKKIRFRYISVMEDESVFKNLDGTIKLNNLPNFNGTEFKFTCNVNDDYLCNAIANVQLVDKNQIGQRVFSIVDIEIKSDVSDSSLQGLDNNLECIHFHEKNLFFLLMSDEFVESRNPKYS